MRRVFSFLLTALLVPGVAACHHKHQTNKLARPPLSANNNNLRNNLNNIGRRKRQTFGNTGLGLGGSNLPNTGVRNPGVTNTNTRPEEGYGLQPWSKLYWPLWFDCHKHRATGRLAFQVCRKQFAQTGYLGGFALTWLETRTCIVSDLIPPERATDDDMSGGLRLR